MFALPRLVRGLTFALAGVVVSAGAAQFAPAAVHADGWCIFDPIVSINGQQTRILLGVEGPSSLVTGIVARTVVYVPAGVKTSIVELPKTGAFVDTVTFVTQGVHSGNGPIPVTIKTTFTSLTKLNTDMQVTYPSGATQTVYGNTRSILSVGFSQ